MRAHLNIPCFIRGERAGAYDNECIAFFFNWDDLVIPCDPSGHKINDVPIKFRQRSCGWRNDLAGRRRRCILTTE